jgi:hypothetical protein
MALILDGSNGLSDVDGSASTPAIRGTDANTGIFFPAADTIAVSTGGTERMRIDSSGNVLVNTTGTGADGINIAVSKNISFAEGSGVSYANMFRQSSSAALVLAMGYKYTATASGFASSVGTSIAKSAISLGTVAGGITFYADAAVTTANGTDVTPTERMRITSGGNLLVGTTDVSLTTGIGYKYAASATDPYIGIVQQGSTNSNTNYHLYSTGAAAYRFYVGLAGTIYATSTTITALSDARLKENIQDIDVGLDKVMALKPRKFDWKDGKGKDKKGDRGWIAQEFEQVFPDMIDTWKDPAPEGEEPYKSVNADLIPVLVKAIQELKAELDATKAEVEALKGAQ